MGLGMFSMYITLVPFYDGLQVAYGPIKREGKIKFKKSEQ